jgi:hypothetical protein
VRRRWWLTGLAALCIAGSGIVAVLDRAAQGEDGAAGDVDGRVAAYSRRIGLPLPPGTRAEFADWTIGLDDACRLVLVMPEAGWAALRSSLPSETFEAEGSYRLGPDEGRWTPRQAPGLVSAQFFPWRGAEAMNIGFAPAGPGEIRVFVFWHQT